MNEDHLQRPRRAEEFKGVFKFLDKNNDGKLELVEMRYIMDAMNCECSDQEIMEIINDIQPGSDHINAKHFLNFCANQLQQDPREELRETWKVASKFTEKRYGSRDKDGGKFSADDFVEVMQALGEEIPVEEAQELVSQAAKSNKGRHVDFDEFVQLLSVPAGAGGGGRQRPGRLF
jgi:Ca2+-binding EF-hand superfamily protein